MKKYLILGLTIAAAADASAQSRSFSAPATTKRRSTTQREVVTPSVRPVGAFPRAARGNPIQMINPTAPARYYGPPEETVAVSPYYRAAYEAAREGARYTGLIFFGLRW